MSMPWFRLYHEMINDPKVGTLNDAEFRTWIEILCVACEAGLDGNTGMDTEQLTWKLRRNVTETLPKLLDRHLVTVIGNKDGETVAVTNWEKRQFQSDSSTDRVRKYRENKKNKYSDDETFQERSSNAIEQIQIRTDTDKEASSSTVTTKEGDLQPIRKDAFLDQVVEVLEAFGVNGNRYALAEELRHEYRESEVLTAIAELATSKTTIRTPVGFIRGYLKKNFLRRGQVSL